MWAPQNVRVTATSATVLKRVFLQCRGAMDTLIVLTEAMRFPDVTPKSTTNIISTTTTNTTTTTNNNNNNNYYYYNSADSRIARPTTFKRTSS